MSEPSTRHPLLRRLTWAGVAVALLWVAFFDGHSLLKRARYVHERSVLRQEVRALQAENEAIAERLAIGLSDEVVEEVAREQYGMRRPGETVYPVEHGTP
jgi:cell division protein FtsB